MAFASVHDMKAALAHGFEDALDGLDRRSREREIITHLIDISTLPTEVRLHVDDKEKRYSPGANRHCKARDKDRLRRIW